MDIMEMAKDLGKAIADCPQMAKMKETEKIQNNDEEAQKLIGEYNLRRMQLAQKAQKEDISKEELEAVRDELNAEFDKLLQNHAINAYVTAKKDVEALIAQVNNILSYYITGEQQQGCGHSCDSCSGCH